MYSFFFLSLKSISSYTESDQMIDGILWKLSYVVGSMDWANIIEMAWIPVNHRVGSECTEGRHCPKINRPAWPHSWHNNEEKPTPNGFSLMHRFNLSRFFLQNKITINKYKSWIGLILGFFMFDLRLRVTDCYEVKILLLFFWSRDCWPRVNCQLSFFFFFKSATVT